MKRNVNPVALITEKGLPGTGKTLFKVKLQAVLYSLLLYQNEKPLRIFFLGVLRVTIVLSKCFEKVLKEYTATLLYQRLGIKHLDITHLHVL